MNIIVVLILLAISAVANGDSKAPISVDAQRSEIDNNSGVTTYLDNVVINQDKFQLRADKVIVYRKQGQVVSLRASGKPVKFSQQLSKNSGITSGTAEKVEYIVSDNTLFLQNYSIQDSDGNQQRGKKATFRLAQ